VTRASRSTPRSVSPRARDGTDDANARWAHSWHGKRGNKQIRPVKSG
jgi:hypothetical protein